jgi:phosphatidate phosphatase PAH1
MNYATPSTFLVLTIHREDTEFNFAIYRKTTQTDTIHQNSCHSYGHKLLIIQNTHTSSNQISKGKRLNAISRTLENSVVQLFISRSLPSNGYASHNN